MLAGALSNLPQEKEVNSMQNLYEWANTLPQQSPASSYAETDCADSDIDSNDGQRSLEAKRKFVARDAQRVWARTAPISIPSGGRQQLHSHRWESVVESPDLSYHADLRLLRPGRYVHAENEDELDEDDPAFYGNLAFFRSQTCCMVKRSAYTFKSTSMPTSPTGVDDRDEDIFAMEL